MRKFFLLTLLFAATTLFAATKVEDFTPKDGTKTAKVYETSPVTKECNSGIKWTLMCGGLQQNLGQMGSTNWATIVRAKYANETFDGYPYIMSDSIEGGIDSLSFTWNSNGKETGYTWKVKVYVNDVEVGSIEEAGQAQITAAPFRTFESKSNLKVEGKFVIKISNESVLTESANKLRLVVDDLTWITYGAPEKETPTFKFADDILYKKTDVIAFTNAVTSTSDGTVAYKSSDATVAEVAADGTVTLKGKVGTVTITASVPATDTYKAAEASYTLRVVPLNFNLETFDGAANVDLEGTATYLTKATESFNASTATGLKWTTLLGSVRNSLGGSPSTNMAAAIRAKKSAEENYGYLTATIEGGIDSLAFDWNSNGDESARTYPWNLEIYINDEKIGAITDACTAMKPLGSWYRFNKGNLKVDGEFTIKIVNKNDADGDGTGNNYRWVMDNLEWYSYEAPCANKFGVITDGEDSKYTEGVYDNVKNEVKVDIHLDKGQQVALYDKCGKTTFAATQEEGGYWFTVTDGKWYAPAAGTYTIYIKLNPGNDVVWTSMDPDCKNEFGAIKGGDVATYTAGQYDAVKNESKIVVHLDLNQEVALYDNCNGVVFYATQEEGTGSYWFTVTDGKWYAPAAGTYTIYLKLNPGNDVIWTSFEADLPSGFENTALKNGTYKTIENGVMVIYRNGIRYTVQGQNF